jgi:hypothetical protein
VADLTPQEIIDRITRGLEITRKQFARPKKSAKAPPAIRRTVKKKARALKSRKAR